MYGTILELQVNVKVTHLYIISYCSYVSKRVRHLKLILHRTGRDNYICNIFHVYLNVSKLSAVMGTHAEREGGREVGGGGGGEERTNSRKSKPRDVL